MLPASVAPGYPAETLGHSLHNTFSMWFDEAAEQMRIDRARAGLETGGETEDQTQEKMFVLRPFAFALQKVRLPFARWAAACCALTLSRFVRLFAHAVQPLLCPLEHTRPAAQPGRGRGADARGVRRAGFRRAASRRQARRRARLVHALRQGVVPQVDVRLGPRLHTSAPPLTATP